MSDPEAIRDKDEILNRQVPWGLWDPKSDEPMWTAFGPQTRDAGMMSTLRGRVSPAEAYRRHTEGTELHSRGTWGVRVGDANDLGVACLDDGGTDDNPVDHASADFRPLQRPGRRIAMAELHILACQRGPLHVPSEDAPEPSA